MSKETESTPGVSDFIATIRRRRRVMLFVGVPIAVIAGVIAVSLPKIYIAPAEFRFESSAISELQGGRQEVGDYADEYVNKLSDAVLTPQSFMAMRRDLGLLPELALPDEKVIGLVAKGVKVEMVTQRILDPQSGRQKDVNSGFKVSYQSRNPQHAQTASQWLANRFITVSRERRRDKSLHTAGFLGTEAERFRLQITQLESKLADFKSKHFDELPESAQSNMATKERTEQDLNNLELDIRTQQQNQIFLESQLQQTQANGGDNETVQQLQEEYRRKAATYDENHPDMIALRKQIETARRVGSSQSGTSLKAQLETQKGILLQMRQRYSDDHPDVKRVEREISNLQARIAGGDRADAPVLPTNPVVMQLQTQIRSNANQIASLEVRRLELRNKLAQIENHLGSSPQVEKEYQQLTRDLGVARDSYDRLTKQRMDTEFQAAASMAGSGDEFRLTDPPVLPMAPAKPARTAIALLGLILGTVLAFVAGLAAEGMDQTVRGSRDVLRLLDLTPMAIVPEIRNSNYIRRRNRQIRVFAASLIVGVPLLYLLVQFAVR